ncbi:MAG: hypothetical protein KIT73_10975 [Burkholderiales bacterium]|nr:hypothetical protein [Burkholderiales bacterium]
MTTEVHAGFPAETILREWLADDDINLFCGRWDEGSIMELLPAGNAVLTDPKYDGPFAGLRDLRIAGSAHHIHLDFGKLDRVQYRIAPSVCFGFRPSFEIRFHRDRRDPATAYGLGLAVATPYAHRQLNLPTIERYVERMQRHRTRFPDTVSFHWQRRNEDDPSTLSALRRLIAPTEIEPPVPPDRSTDSAALASDRSR